MDNFADSVILVTLHLVVLVLAARNCITVVSSADVVVIADLGRPTLTFPILALVHGGADIAVITRAGVRDGLASLSLVA